MKFIFKRFGKEDIYYDTIYNTLKTKENFEVFHNTYQILPKPKNITLRIALGKNCNYHCKYCYQVENVCMKKSINISQLVKRIYTYQQNVLKNPITKIMFWGGEPFCYFEEIKEFVEVWRKYYPSMMNFQLFTNGSFLYGKYYEWILKNNIIVSLSHDGPGQFVRGDDPLEEKEILDNVKNICNNSHHMIINPVFHSENPYYLEWELWMKNKIAENGFVMGSGRYVQITDQSSYEYRIPEKQMEQIQSKNCEDIRMTRVRTHNRVRNEATEWVFSLGISVGRITPRCFIHSPNTITIDVEGNILPCQNYNADTIFEKGDSALLGNIFLEEKAKIPECLSMQYRLDTFCYQCPYVNVCKGGCPYTPLEEKYRKQNCLQNKMDMFTVFSLGIQDINQGKLQEIIPIEEE